jgi:hypothetical protein
MAGLIHLELLTDFFNKIGQKQTNCIATKVPLFNHLVCESSQFVPEWRG